MSTSKSWALVSVASLALLCAPAFAQTEPDTSAQDPAVNSDDASDEGVDGAASLPTGAPTSENPAETESPELPAAAGGTASDATRSGGPAGSTGPMEESGGAPAVTGNEPGEPSGDALDPAETEEQPAAQMPADDNAGASPRNPRNAVGDKFELPQVSRDNQREMIAGLCGLQMKAMTTQACGCLADQALTTLSAPQRDYLIASAIAPPVADRMLGDGRIAQSDQRTIFTFLNSTSEACKTDTVTPGASPETPSGEPSPPMPGSTTPERAQEPDAPAGANGADGNSTTAQ